MDSFKNLQLSISEYVSSDTFFTVITTLIVFIAGIIVDRSLKYYDKRREQRELRIYLQHYLNIITDKTCEKLIDIYNHFYRFHGVDEGIPLAPPKILTSNFSRIRGIQDKDLFHAFKERETLSSILSKVDFLELSILEIDRYHNFVRQEADDIRKPLQSMVNKYFDTLAKYLLHMENEKNREEKVERFVKLVNQSIVLYHTNPDMKQNIKSIYRLIIRPIQDEVVITDIYRYDSVGIVIADLGKQISFSYNNYRSLVLQFRMNYRNFSKQIKDAQNELRSEHKIVNWL